MEAARQSGTHNVVALTTYGSMENDPELAVTILKEALTLNPKYAPAHWTLGEKLDEKPRRMMEWKQAVALAPRNYEWLTQYAKLCEELKQYAEAGRAWLAAAQAAPDTPLREKALAARGQIEQMRLDDEYEVRRREAAAKTAEIGQLKAQALQEVRDLEARANSKPLDKSVKVVDWDEVNKPPVTMAATLTRVDCAGKAVTLTVKEATGKLQKILIRNVSTIEIKGGDGTLTCGIHRPRPIAITSSAGEVIGVELR